MKTINSTLRFMFIVLILILITILQQSCSKSKEDIKPIVIESVNPLVNTIWKINYLSTIQFNIKDGIEVDTIINTSPYYISKYYFTYSIKDNIITRTDYKFDNNGNIKDVNLLSIDDFIIRNDSLLFNNGTVFKGIKQ